MKVTSIVKTEKLEGADEFKLSLLIHLAILFALSAFFVIRQASAQPIKKQVVPVKLVSPAQKTKIGSATKPAKKVGAKKSAGKAKKVVKKTSKVPTKKVTPKKIIKTTKITKAKANAKVLKKIEPVKPITKALVTTPVQTESIATSAKPSVVQETKNQNLPVKPTHNSPAFDSISHLTSEKAAATELDPEMASLGMTEPIENLMPDSFLDDEKSESMPDQVIPMPAGLENEKPDNGSGLFEIGSIESFGGNGENFSAPGIVRKVLPDYPDWARKKGVHGSAVYRVLIQPGGTVGDVVTMTSTIDPKLAINGAQALRRWVFTPVLANGDPQSTWVKITVQYKLN